MCSNNSTVCNQAYLYCGDKENSILRTACLPIDSNDIDPNFGIYVPALNNVSQSTNFLAKLFYCVWWGLQNLRFVQNRNI
jgi:cyclic nucleotide gated channel